MLMLLISLYVGLEKRPHRDRVFYGGILVTNDEQELRAYRVSLLCVLYWDITVASSPNCIWEKKPILGI